MAYRSNNPFQQVKQDTGWGLIYRLNRLMDKIELDNDAGDLEKWNLHLDRIYANIIFKDPTEIIKDSKGNILSIKFTPEDTNVFQDFAKRIIHIKNLIALEKQKKNPKVYPLRHKLYNTIFKKDIWMRKKMFELKLYLREAEHDPRKAIYGS